MTRLKLDIKQCFMKLEEEELIVKKFKVRQKFGLEYPNTILEVYSKL